MKKRVRKLGWNARNADGVEKWVSYVCGRLVNCVWEKS